MRTLCDSFSPTSILSWQRDRTVAMIPYSELQAIGYHWCDATGRLLLTKNGQVVSIKPQLNENHQWFYRIRIGGKQYAVTELHIVCGKHHGDPRRGQRVLVRDGNPFNISPDNLCWTSMPNAKDISALKKEGRHLRARTAARIHEAFLAGTDVDDLAKQYDVSPLYIRNVLRGKLFSKTYERYRDLYPRRLKKPGRRRKLFVEAPNLDRNTSESS